MFSLSLEYKLHDYFCSLLYPQHLKQCPAPNKYLSNATEQYLTTTSKAISWSVDPSRASNLSMVIFLILKMTSTF